MIETKNFQAVCRTVLAVISEKTGYPVDSLELDHRTDDDLGINSIHAVEILNALQKEFPTTPPIPVEGFGTIGDVARWVYGNSPNDPSTGDLPTEQNRQARSNVSPRVAGLTPAKTHQMVFGSPYKVARADPTDGDEKLVRSTCNFCLHPAERPRGSEAEQSVQGRTTTDEETGLTVHPRQRIAEQDWLEGTDATPLISFIVSNVSAFPCPERQEFNLPIGHELNVNLDELTYDAERARHAKKDWGQTEEELLLAHAEMDWRACEYREDGVDFLMVHMQQFGHLRPILVYQNGVIIAGFRRYRAAKALGWKTIKVRVVRCP